MTHSDSPVTVQENAQRIDTLIRPEWIIPVEPVGVTLTHHAIAIDQGIILAIGPAAALTERYAARQVIDLPGQLVLPGLINLHCHTPMALMRGFADDLPLMDWLQQHIWPAETQHMSHEFVRDGSLLAMAELLKSGTTTVNDMYFHPAATAQAALIAGIRATLGITVLEFPTPYASDANGYIERGLAAHAEFLGEPTLRFSLAPHAPYTVSDGTFSRLAALADELELPIHCHIHETAGEVSDGLKLHGHRPLERLARLGLVNNRLIAVHMVHLTGGEIELLAREGAHIAHCPTSNLKLASGIAPTAALLSAGVNVGIGTDGAASNNTLDMLAELRLAALLAKGQSGDATAWGAHATLAAATLNGARALGLKQQVGSLLPGKQADLISLNLQSIATQPLYDAASHAVYSAGRGQVTHVWVAGRHLVNNGQLTQQDERELVARAQHWQAKLAP